MSHKHPAGSGDPEKPSVVKDDLDIGTTTTTREGALADASGRTYTDDNGSPLEQPPQIAGEMLDDRKTKSAPVGLDGVSKLDTDVDDGIESPPMPPHPRTSLQLNRPHPQPRTSTQRARASEEFDRRYDGPYGRPSLAMARRRSSGLPQTMEDTEMDMVEPTVTTSGGEQVLVPPFQPEPPRLGYTLRTRKMAIFLFWSIILFDSVVMPIALYFGLWYGVGPGNPDNEKLSANTVFSIVTAALGGASILEYFVRFWRLYKKNSTCRVGLPSWHEIPKRDNANTLPGHWSTQMVS